MQRAIGILIVVLLCGQVYGQKKSASNGSSGSPSGRIVNGTTASIQNYPFVVVLQVNGYIICGGSIITAKHALTAAHCVEDKPAPATVTLRAGSSTHNSGGVVFRITSYVSHPSYSPTTTDNDAAIITIAGSFAGYPNVRSIGLQNTELTVSSSTPTWCYALGWGYTNGVAKTLAQTLQFVWLQLQSAISCAAVYGTGAITPQMICAQYPNVDMCNGDSGGPLVCDGLLTGIVSFGALRCPGKYPSVFGKVASTSIRSFIRTNAGI